MKKGVHARDQLALSSALRGAVERGTVCVMDSSFIFFPTPKVSVRRNYYNVL